MAGPPTPFDGVPVLVTGHTGFKGSWLSLWLARLGARVTGLALAPEGEPNLFEVARVGEVLAGHHEIDVRDDRAVAALVAATGPAVVFHLAAQPLVGEGYRRPVETFATNVVRTAGVLDGVRRAERPCVVVVVTSDKCYDEPGGVWGRRETDPLGGAEPYSASKGAAELVTAAYRRAYFSADGDVLVALARAGNVVGGGDWAADRIVPDAVRALAAGRPVPVRNPTSTRPWQHVLEPLSGYLPLAERLLAGDHGAVGAWNFGPPPGPPVPAGELVDRVCRAWGSGTWEHAPAPGAGPEEPALALAIDKASAELGWWPRWDLAETVARTVGWYRRFHDGPGGPADLRRACDADIAAYGKAAVTTEPEERP